MSGIRHTNGSTSTKYMDYKYSLKFEIILQICLKKPKEEFHLVHFRGLLRFDMS